MSRQFRIRVGGEWREVSAEQYAAIRGKPDARGLGDLVHAVAHPIAKTIDAVAGTKIAECGGCAKRRAALNRIVPRF